jgi:general secretion pathway protein I
MQQRGMQQRGFTLLEIMVATLIMGIAVVGVLSAMSTSIRNAARLTAYDRAVMLGRSKMDELLVDTRIPLGATLDGKFDSAADGSETGWNARITPFNAPPDTSPGTHIIERIELEIWWTSGNQRFSFPLEGYKQAVVVAPSN